MIQFTIVTNERINAGKVAELLLKEKMVINVNLIAGMEQFSKTKTGVILEKKFVLNAIMRASQYSTVENRIKETFPDIHLEFMAVPVVNTNCNIK